MTPLVTTDWLADNLEQPSLRIADVRWYLDEPSRGNLAYREGHIPGAVYVHLENDLSGVEGGGRHPLPAPSQFAVTMGRLGFGSDDTVVAYDDRGGAVAARLWWMLRSLGHGSAAVLDGGLTAWTAEGRPLTDGVPRLDPAHLVLSDTWKGTVDRQGVAEAIGDATLVDARSPARYRGEQEQIDPVAGHIPSAVNAPYEENLGALDRFLPATELAARYRALGIDTADEVIVYCGSGVTACHDLLALEVSGLDGARLYPGSWSDWSSAGLGVATGSDPG